MKRLLITFLIIGSLLTGSDVYAKNYEFEVLSTTDMHGRATTKEVFSKKIDFHSMEKVATVVKKERKKYGKKLILIDNGDLLQGTLVSQYALNYEPKEENPMVTALKYLKYDVWVMGNHEFNYSPEQRDTQVEYAQKSNIAVLGANIVLKNNGYNVFGEKCKKGSPFYTPYIIKTIKFGCKKNVRVAIIGLGNANNEKWDRSENYPNLQFHSIDNPQGLLENEVKYWVDKIKNNNEADIIIVSAHTGKTTDTNMQIKKFSMESQIISGAKNSKDVDLFIYGHDHQMNIEQVENLDEKKVYIVNAGGVSVTKNVFNVSFDEKNNFKDCTVSANTILLENQKNDKKLGKMVEESYKKTEKWISTPVSKFEGGWNNIQYQVADKTNEDLVFEQTELCNLIHKVQIWSSWQNQKSIGAEVSIMSPIFATDTNKKILYVPKDDDILDISKLALLYRFDNNLLCMVDMTPEQLYAWLNCVANKLTLDENKCPKIKPDASLHGVDTFYGIDYIFDLSKPEGQRVVKAQINGEDLLKRKASIRVVLNSFRLAGSHGFREVTKLMEKDAVWTSSETLPHDKASIQAQIGEYAKFVKVLKPYEKPVYAKESKWELVIN